jgi:hypothetical protein
MVTINKKMTKPYHIVFTTIYHPAVLEDLYNNLSKYGHLETVKIWVVGDKKTPDSCRKLVETFRNKGMETVYLDIASQDNWGKRCADFYNRLPYNNETRRNIGYLHALEGGCELLISIDDDNFPTEDDLIGYHRQTGKRWFEKLISETSGFHNICEYLETEPNRQIFPRGYPFRLRGLPNHLQNISTEKTVTIGVTAGLWLSDPDVDATTWINGKIVGTRYLGKAVQVLDQSTWTPINTQNTSIVRELIPAYLCIPMGWSVPGGSIQRYGDIWGGYFLQALMKGTDYHVAFGRPIVNHRRNPHDYVDDLRYEYWGMILTDWLLDKLRREFHPQSDIITNRVDQLADFINQQTIPELPNWCPKEIGDFFSWTAGNLKTWSTACRILARD